MIGDFDNWSNEKLTQEILISDAWLNRTDQLWPHHREQEKRSNQEMRQELARRQK